MEEKIVDAIGIIKKLGSVVDKALVAVIILLIGLILGRLLGRIAQKSLHELNLNQLFKKATDVSASLEEIAGYSIKYFIYFLSVIMALNQLGLASRILEMISAAVLIIIIIAVFLGVKDLIPNFIAGLSIYKRGFISKGDFIEVNGMEGRIIRINLLETRIRSKKGDIISIPNTIITQNRLAKKSK